MWLRHVTHALGVRVGRYVDVSSEGSFLGLFLSASSD